MSELLYTKKPEKKISDLRQYVKTLSKSLIDNFQKNFQEVRSTYIELNSKLQTLNPKAVLKRGYSISRFVTDKRVIRNSIETKKNDKIEIVLSKGRLITRVEKING